MELSSEEGTVRDDEGKGYGKAETSGFDRQTDLGEGHGTADRSPSSRKEGTMRDSSAEGSSDQGKADGKAESSRARQSEIGGGQERFKSEVRMQVRTASTADQKSSSLSQKKDKENAGPTDESDEKSSTSEVVGQQKTSYGDRQSDVQKNDGRCTEHPDGKESSKPAEDGQ